MGVEGGGAIQPGKYPAQPRTPEKRYLTPFPSEEIIEDFEAHIRKRGGAFGEGGVGTAKDAHGEFFRRHLAADFGEGLAYREAYTTTAAEEVIDHLVNECGLHVDRDSVPEPGKIVFVYRPTTPNPSSPSGGVIAEPTPQPEPAAVSKHAR
jgi:hypothetical protein